MHRQRSIDHVFRYISLDEMNFARSLIEIPDNLQKYLDDQDVDFTDNDNDVFVQVEPEDTEESSFDDAKH